MPELNCVSYIDSFKWRKLKEFIYSKAILNVEDKILERLTRCPVLPPGCIDYKHLDEYQPQSIRNYFFFLATVNEFKNDPYKNEFSAMLLNYMSIMDPSAGGLIFLSFFLFRRAIEFMGTERHVRYYEAAAQGKITGTVCITEIGHGSNMKLLQTTATYHSDKDEFVLNTPTFEAAKCWSENLGRFATHAIVYAQLLMQDCNCYGIHPFVVPIRHPQTLIPYPGVSVSSCGEKIGFNGADHGFLVFNNYCVPRECLLNKFADITSEGEYVMQDSDGKGPITALNEMLYAARTDTICANLMFLVYAITVTARLSTVQKQIAWEAKPLSPIQNPLHQFRLVPYISATYVAIIFTKHLRQLQNRFLSLSGEVSDNFISFSKEIQLISLASKSLFMPLIRDGTTECLESCKEHGYLQISALASIKYICEAGCTAEGVTEVLVQQASNILLKLWRKVLKKENVSFPMQSIDFLNRAFEILNFKFNISSSEAFLEIQMYYKWLVCYLLKKAYEKRQQIFIRGKKKFWATHDNQIYYCKQLTYAYIEHYTIQEVSSYIATASDRSVKLVLNNLLSLYALWSLQKFVVFFYKGEYASGSKFGQLLEESVLLLCHSLKDDTMALASVISLPDFIFSSVLGTFDGEIFKGMENLMQSFSTANWINEVFGSKISSKL